jgi:hypothetical protein
LGLAQGSQILVDVFDEGGVVKCAHSLVSRVRYFEMVCRVFSS